MERIDEAEGMGGQSPSLLSVETGEIQAVRMGILVGKLVSVCRDRSPWTLECSNVRAG